MKGFLLKVYILAMLVLTLYFAFWPVPIEPVAWNAPHNPGYTGPFSKNERLKVLEFVSIGELHGPESVEVDDGGWIYCSTHEGWIVRVSPDGSRAEKWVQTGGRPLGLAFDGKGNLIVADAFRGLISIGPDGRIKKLASECEGVPILYADDVDVAQGGRIFFTDASTKFGAREYGGTYQASILDIMEHGGHGRLLMYDPEAGKTSVVVKGLNFANGVALSHDGNSVLVNETGSYRVIRVWISGLRMGRVEPLIEGLPGFPDNIKRGQDGRYWVALVSPRNALLDMLAPKPFLRKVLQRLPTFARPEAKAYGHIIAIDDHGRVLEDLQDPEGRYPAITSVKETKDYLYLGSLMAPTLARIHKAKVGI